ncbi:MAG TPA: ribokinase, partial [Clostridia bacterium]|nr:ribokinase [Clostridia bacterium]
LIRRFGGKGANQAIAAARQQAAVRMVGCVGDDEAGQSYLARLGSEGVDVRGITVAKNVLTGTALIAVDRSAENLIIVAPGANGKLTPAMVRRQRAAIETANAVLLQFEVPFPALIEAVRIANQAGVPVYLNPSPMHTGFTWAKCRVDTLIVNAGEARTLFGLEVARVGRETLAWRKAMRRKRIGTLVITRGARATVCITADELYEVPTPTVKPVDTVGAGDAFAGTYVASRSEGLAVLEALHRANYAGALATLKRGAQESIPSRREIDKKIRAFPRPG